MTTLRRAKFNLNIVSSKETFTRQPGFWSATGKRITY